MTFEEIERRSPAWFALASVVVPSIAGLLFLARQEIATAIHSESTLAAETLIALFISCALGVTFAVISLYRREKWRWLAILGLVANAIGVTIFLLLGVIILLLWDRKIV